MPTVPEYNLPQVAPAGLPNVQIQGLSPRQLMQGEISAHQTEQGGQDATVLGVQAMDAQTRANALANQTRVDDAVNQVLQFKQQQTYDPQQGYLAKTGAAAIQPNAQGQGLQDVYAGKLQDQISSVASTLSNDAQRQAFAQATAKITNQFDGELLSHVARENRQFGLDTQKGAVDLATDGAAKTWDDPDAIATQVDSVKAAVWKAGQIAGEPANLIQAKQLDATSKLHLGVIDQALTNNSPEYAHNYLDRFKADMTAGDLLRASRSVDGELNGRQAVGAAQAAVGQFQGAIAPTDVDRMLNITRQAESGGKDTNADGTPVVSPKGARYGMQVMPATAANPGFGITPAQADTPAEYNRVGTQYLGALVKNYAGDAGKAWAAYNAGPGAVDAAVKQAGPGGNWLALLPKETQDYVSKNMTTLQAGGGAPDLPTKQQVEQAVRDRLGPDPNPQVLDRAIQEADRQFTSAVQSRKEQGDQAVQDAQRYLAQNQGDFNSLPADMRSKVMQLAPEKLPELQTFASKVANPPKTDNMAAYHLAIEHPDELAKMTDAQFNQFAMTNFSEATQKQVAKLRQDTANATSDNSAGGLNARALTQTISNRLLSLGVNPTPASIAGRAQIGTIQKALTDSVFAEQQQLGRKMTAAEIEKFVDQQFMKNADVKEGFFSDRQVPYLTMKTDDIPSDELNEIRTSLGKKGLTSPTNDQLMRMYWSKHMGAAPGGQPQQGGGSTSVLDDMLSVRDLIGRN